jgi:hypothetical protein
MPITDLWLDDDPRRKLPICGISWTWVRTADEAILALQTGTVEFASLDHDLADEHYVKFFEAEENGTELDTSDCKERTGYDVLLWMRENNVWPSEGVRIHTMNTVRKPIMLAMVYEHYGRTFQYQYAGTHNV